MKTLNDEQYRALACALGKAIRTGKKTYAPVPREKILQTEENLRISSKITEAFETLSGAPTPSAMIDATWPVQRNQHRRTIRGIIEWLADYQAVLGDEDDAVS